MIKETALSWRTRKFRFEFVETLGQSKGIERRGRRVVPVKTFSRTRGS